MVKLRSWGKRDYGRKFAKKWLLYEVGGQVIMIGSMQRSGYGRKLGKVVMVRSCEKWLW